jgi:cytochrome P450
MPQRINALRPRLQNIADALFDAIDMNVSDGDEFDLTARYIAQLPLMSIAAMLGIPPEDFIELHSWTQSMLVQDEANVRDALVEFTSYLNRQIDIRRQNPDAMDDVLSALIFAEDAGDRLTRQELLSTVFLLITAGYETMVNFISNSIMTLFEHPEQMQALQRNIDNPVILKSAIEELLRFNGPSHMTLASWAIQDVVLRDKVIHQGDIVHAVLFAANRDPLVFDNPHQFDIMRHPNKHIAFSYGIHHCLGAALARIEGEIAIATLLRRMPNL